MKEEIVKEYLSKGKLLTPEALEAIIKGGGLNEGDVIITEKVVRDQFKVLKNITSKKNELSVQDFIDFYRSRYERMKDIIMMRAQKKFISLNKLDSYRNEVFVIGMVRDMKEKDDRIVVDFEDPTACVPIIFEKDSVSDLALDDVVAVRAISAKNVMFGKQIIFPDTPLRAAQTGFGKICVLTNLNLDEIPKTDAERIFSWVESQDLHYIIVTGNTGDMGFFEQCVLKYCGTKKVIFIPGIKDAKDDYPNLAIPVSLDNITSLSNPSIVSIGGVNIMLTTDFDISMLKKRHLGTSKSIMDEDDLVMDHVPDIVCFASEAPKIINHKSVTAVSAGSTLASFMPSIIDLATRETNQHILVSK